MLPVVHWDMAPTLPTACGSLPPEGEHRALRAAGRARGRPSAAMLATRILTAVVLVPLVLAALAADKKKNEL